MKKTTRFIANIGLAVAALCTFSACDEVSELDRYVELPSLQNVERTALLQDFTGQNCVNCPAAHEIMELLSEQYGDNLICVSIHAGSLAIPVENTSYTSNYVGLKTVEGDIYNDAYGINKWPMGNVDCGPALEPDQWATAVREQLEKEPGASLKLTAELVEDQIVIDSEIIAKSDFTGQYVIWVVENGIVARQRTPNGAQTDYVHNHVFRAAVNGVWGEEVTLEEGMLTNYTHKIELRDTETEKWDPANIDIVAYVHNDGDIWQAAKTHLVVE